MLARFYCTGEALANRHFGNIQVSFGFNLPKPLGNRSDSRYTSDRCERHPKLFGKVGRENFSRFLCVEDVLPCTDLSKKP